MTMTHEHEEKLIAEAILVASEMLEIAKKEKRAATNKQQQAQQNYDDMLQAALDYMQGNGLVECDSFVMTKSYRVDVESVDSVPEEYQRIKTTIEVDKARIKADKPAANWYTIAEHKNVKVKVV